MVVNMGKAKCILALTSYLFLSVIFTPAYGSMKVNVLTPGGHGALYPGDDIPYVITFDAPRDRVPRTSLYAVLVPTPNPENPSAPRPIFPWTVTLSNRTTTDVSRKIPSDLNVFGNFTIDIHLGKNVYGRLLASSNVFTISPTPLHRKILDRPFVIQTTWGTYLKFLVIYFGLLYIWRRWRRKYLKRKLTVKIAQAIARARAQGRSEALESRGTLVPLPSFLAVPYQVRQPPRRHENDIEAGNIEGEVTSTNKNPISPTPPNVDVRALVVHAGPTLPTSEKEVPNPTAFIANDIPVADLTSIMAHDPHCEPLAGLAVGQTDPSTSPSPSRIGAREETQDGIALAVRVQELTNTVEQLQTLLALRSNTPGAQLVAADDIAPPPMYSESSRDQTAG